MLLNNDIEWHKGDLTLNIEPQIGMTIPSKALLKNNTSAGIELALQATVHYYFADFFSLNAGLGYGFNYNEFAISGNSNGIGFILRSSGSFADVIADPSSPRFIEKAVEASGIDEVYSFKFFTVSALVTFPIKLANLPIGGKQGLGMYGTEIEVKLRNEFSQKAIARECAGWIRKKVKFHSNITNACKTKL